MFEYHFHGTQMFLGKFGRTGKIVLFYLFFIIVFYFIHIQLTGTKCCQQVVYLILG